MSVVFFLEFPWGGQTLDVRPAKPCTNPFPFPFLLFEPCRPKCLVCGREQTYKKSEIIIRYIFFVTFICRTGTFLDIIISVNNSIVLV